MVDDVTDTNEIESRLIDKPGVQAKESNVYLWIKSASIQDDDKAEAYELEYDSDVRGLILLLQRKIFFKDTKLSDIKIPNPSVQRWVNEIIDGYPVLQHEAVEDLLNSYRYALRGRSKETGKYILALLRENRLLLAHSKSSSVITLSGMTMRAAKTILSYEGVLRADLIHRKESNIFLAAFEQSKSFSKGHADFWGLDETDVVWDSMGDVILQVQLEDDGNIIHIPVSFDDVERLYRERILVSGKYKRGIIVGTVVRVQVGRVYYEFDEFWDRYLHQREQIQRYTKWFESTIKHGSLDDSYPPKITKYRYDEDQTRIWKHEGSEKKVELLKEHPTYTLCAFTSSHPGIRPISNLIRLFNDSIFSGIPNGILHIGLGVLLEPIILGSLHIYSELSIDDESLEFSRRILETMASCKDTKTELLMRLLYCRFMERQIDVFHFPIIFEFISDFILPKLEQEFKGARIIDYEGELEYKSKDLYSAKSKVFVENELSSRIQSCISPDGTLRKFVIIYGIEDNGKIEPISNLKSDVVSAIEHMTNKEVSRFGIYAGIHSIPVITGKLLVIFLHPQH